MGKARKEVIDLARSGAVIAEALETFEKIIDRERANWVEVKNKSEKDQRGFLMGLSKKTGLAPSVILTCLEGSYQEANEAMRRGFMADTLESYPIRRKED